MSNKIACVNMQKQQLRTRNVHTDSIIALFDDLPREDFVPDSFKSFAYSDMQIPLGHGQCMMTPVEEALLLQSLQLQGHEVVLEVGTGSGYLTAMLSRMCKKVISVDYFKEFTSFANQKLSRHQCDNVELLTGDASMGWLDLAPYDVIVFTGAMAGLTDLQKLQLMPGGKLFVLMGHAPVIQGQLHFLSHDGQWQNQLIFETCLPSLIDTLKSNHFVF